MHTQTSRERDIGVVLVARATHSAKLRRLPERKKRNKKKYLCLCVFARAGPVHIIMCVYNISKVIFFILNVSDAFFSCSRTPKAAILRHTVLSGAARAFDCVAAGSDDR